MNDGRGTKFMIDFVTSVLMLASVFYSQPASASDNMVATLKQVQTPRTTEELVRDYFVRTPALVEVARCESTFRQLDSKGVVIRGRQNEYDVGVMQINELYHSDKAKGLGFDLHTLEGNMAYAEWLYRKEGLAPWSASSKCWKNRIEATKA